MTLGEIARRCGVSIPTVSLALRGNTRCASTETIARIKTTAAEIGYDPAMNASARRLVAHHTGSQVVNHVIGLFFPGDAFDALFNYYTIILQQILAAVDEEEFCLLTNYRMSDARIEEKRLPLVYRRGEVDGVLTIDPYVGFHQTLDLLREAEQFGDRPIVTLVHQMPGCSAVIADDYQAGMLAAGRLLDAGHRRLLHFFASDDPGPWAQRLAGFQQACRLRGLDPAACLTATVWRPEAGDTVDRESLLALLRRHAEITAILPHNDNYAARIVGHLRDAGYRIPADLSVVSFDDTDPIYDDQRRNILTTVHMPLAEIGRQGASLLIRLVTGEEPGPRTHMLPVHLVERASVIPPRRLGD